MVVRRRNRLHKPVCCSSSKNKTIRMKLGTSKACKYGKKELETGSDLMLFIWCTAEFSLLASLASLF